MKNYLILGMVYYSDKTIVEGIQVCQKKVEATTIKNAKQDFEEHVRKIFTIAGLGTTIDKIEIKECKQLRIK